MTLGIRRRRTGCIETRHVESYSLNHRAFVLKGSSHNDGTFLYLFDVARESPALEESEGDGAITFKTLDRAGLHAGISNSFLELLLMCFSFFRADVWQDGTLLYHF